MGSEKKRRAGLLKKSLFVVTGMGISAVILRFTGVLVRSLQQLGTGEGLNEGGQELLRQTVSMMKWSLLFIGIFIAIALAALIVAVLAYRRMGRRERRIASRAKRARAAPVSIPVERYAEPVAPYPPYGAEENAATAGLSAGPSSPRMGSGGRGLTDPPRGWHDQEPPGDLPSWWTSGLEQSGVSLGGWRR